MTFDLLVITTTDVEKQKLALQVIKSVDGCNFPFTKKIISIDDFGNPLDWELKNYLHNNGWTYDLHSRLGMCENVLKGLTYCDSDWVLYSEDDVLVNKLPSIEDFDLIKNSVDLELGIVSLLSSRGTGFMSKDKWDLMKKNISSKENYINGNDYSAWVRTEDTIDDFFIEFPITFINRKLFLDLFEYANNNLSGYQIEQGLTKAFVMGGFKDKFKKVNYLKPVDVSAYTLLNYWDIMEYVTKNNLFIFNKDNNRQNNLSHSVNGGKNFKIKDW